MLDKYDSSKRIALKFEKRINGYAIVLSGVSDGKKSLTINSFYIINKKKPTTTSDALLKNSPQTSTSETRSSTASSNSIIRNIQEKNNKIINTNNALPKSVNQAIEKTNAELAKNRGTFFVFLVCLLCLFEHVYLSLLYKYRLTKIYKCCIIMSHRRIMFHIKEQRLGLHEQ